MMDAVRQKVSVDTGSAVLIGVADSLVAERITSEMRRFGREETAEIVLSLDKLRQAFGCTQPCAVLVDEPLLNGRPLASAIQPFESRFPVIFLGSADRQGEAAELVARGQIEYVARAGKFFALAAGLIERRLRRVAEKKRNCDWMEDSYFPHDMGEVFRHEINNPLTGILGNAELVLAHRERFSAVETQRLETVVNLAVRLRETIRRLSNSIEMQHKSAAS